MESVIIHKKSDDWSSESMSLSPTSSLRRHTVTPGINNKRALARKHSFTRGTASSLAKAVRPDTKPAVLDNINRKKSLKNRKQSMTTAIDNRAVFMTTTPFLLQQRRSSWSPHTPLQPAEKKSVVVLDQVPSPVMKRVTTPSKLVPADDIRAHIDPPEHPPEPSEPIEQPLPSPKIQQRKKSRDEDSISNKSVASGKIYSNKRSMYTDNRNKLAISSSEKVHRKKRSDDDLKSSVLKAADRRRSMVNFDKCSSTWQLPYNKLDTVDTAVYEAHSPLETPKESRKSLDSITDEVKHTIKVFSLYNNKITD
ncbi:hypothetical protein BDB01DRAFT_33843 [Pilobolus umbonatus]|nr:hypothetical protein BDB01DRAFT_33843 [Pilobolus umbonatus]